MARVVARVDMLLGENKNCQAYAARICARFSLGSPIYPPRSVAGGLLHRMWKLQTERGCYAIKELDARIMARLDADDWYRRTERIAATVAAAGIPALAALGADRDPLMNLDGASVLVYPWVEGAPLPSGPAAPEVAHQIGLMLGRMHALDPRLPGLEQPRWERIADDRWQRLLDLAIAAGDPLATQLAGALPDLRAWSALYAGAVGRLGERIVLGHTDLDQKNVLWPAPGTPVLIDWEAAGLTDPALDVAGAALAWGGLAIGAPLEESVRAFMAGYHEAGRTLEGRGRVGVAGCIGVWLEWLEFNLQRALDRAAYGEEERARGRGEIAPTLARLRVLASGFDTWAAWLE